ncbi:hypothetical protein [Bacillus fungorum]|uniref:hypothetical protein n=1 Tax=Bacillus fungorum TaxID=2039284 RepID=UPI0006A886BC|nr:hypothetical protein BN2127_JRS1_04818 [Bacillus cereus]
MMKFIKENREEHFRKLITSNEREIAKRRVNQKINSSFYLKLNLISIPVIPQFIN